MKIGLEGELAPLEIHLLPDSIALVKARVQYKNYSFTTCVMKLSRFFLSILFLSYFKLNAQDLVVTQKGDSLRCKIESEDAHFMHITMGSGANQKKILLAYDQVRYSEVNFYAKKEGYVNEEDDYRAPKAIYSYPKFRVNVNGGLGYLSAKLSSSIPPYLYDYYNELRKGFTFNAAADYFFLPFFGAGISYSIFRTKNSLSNISAQNTVTGKIVTGKLEDNITVNYVGPRLIFCLMSKGKNAAFLPYFSMGYVSYQNKGIFFEKYTTTANTSGRKAGLDLNYRIDNNFFIGLDISYTTIVLTKISVESNGNKKTVNLKKDEYDNESRADFLVGLRYTF